MSILLSDVQVKMSRIGVHTANASTNLYFPTVTIYYTDPKKKPVSTWIIELGSRFKKSDYLGKVICGDFLLSCSNRMGHNLPRRQISHIHVAMWRSCRSRRRSFYRQKRQYLHRLQH